MKHTPTPWKIEVVEGLSIYGPEGLLLADLKGNHQTKANAAFIVKAVNCHEEMLTALRSVRNEYRRYVLNDPKNIEDAIGSRVLAQIDRAITKAEGK